jgi:hypothetical protein
MRLRARFAAAVSVSLVLALAGASTPSTVPTDAGSADGVARATVIGKGASDALLSALIQELSGAIAAGGPEGAIDICGARAQQIADSLSVVLGVSVKRVSERHRNPADVPSAVERAVLDRFAAAGGEMDTVFVVGEADSLVYRYMRPIYIRTAVCLECHGDPERMRAGVLDRIKARYPDDKATGYSLGDLRGAFTVTIPLGAMAIGPDATE